MRTGLEENKRIVRRQFELLSLGDAKGAAALWSVQAKNHGRPVDPAAIESVYTNLQLLREQHTIHEVVAEGDWVALRTTCRGIHAAKARVNSGIFADAEPTGRAYTVQHMHMFRVVDGKIVGHWACGDDLGAARQAGLDLRPVDTQPR